MEIQLIQATTILNPTSGFLVLGTPTRSICIAERLPPINKQPEKERALLFPCLLFGAFVRGRNRRKPNDD